MAHTLKEYSVDSNPKEKHRRFCCGRPWSRLEIEVIILALILLVLAAGIIVLVVLKVIPRDSMPSEELDKPTVCMTEPCLSTALEVMKYTNSAAPPCDDFVNYSCGKWFKDTEIPAGKSRYNIRTMLKDKINYQLKEFLDESPGPDEPDAVSKLRKWYAMCMDTNAIKAAGARPVREVADQLGGWPIIDSNWDPLNFDLESNLAKVFHAGTRVMMKVKVTTGGFDPYRYVISLVPPRLPLGTAITSGNRMDPKVLAYENYTASIAKYLGASNDEAEKQAAEMVDFEFSLAKHMPPPSYEYDVVNYKEIPLSVSQLSQEISADFQWMKFFNNLFAPLNVTISSDDTVLIRVPEYLRNATKLAKTASPRTIQNFLVWGALMPALRNMPIEDIQTATGNYLKLLEGLVDVPERWMTCVQEEKFDGTFESRDFGYAFSRLYLPKYFDRQSKLQITGMIENLRKAMIQLLEESPLLSTDTKKTAIEKAEAVTFQLGYPDWLYNNTALNLFYSVFEVTDDYFKNVINMRGGGLLSNLRDITEKPGPDRWLSELPPIDVDAIFNPYLNFIAFPAGLLQPPIFHKDYLPAVNYGAIGIIIGHEFTHAFDSLGRHYDKMGYAKDWWTPEDEKKFNDATKCIEEQYEKYELPEGHRIDGKLTLVENIADNGGIRAAFRAYRLWQRTQPLDRQRQLLPGLNVTMDQLFYLSFGRMMCEKIVPGGWAAALQDFHTPETYRITGVTQNTKDFASSFSCPPNAKFNPAKKCRVW